MKSLVPELVVHVVMHAYAMDGHFRTILRCGSVCKDWRDALYRSKKGIVFWKALCSQAMDVEEPSRKALMKDALGMGLTTQERLGSVSVDCAKHWKRFLGLIELCPAADRLPMLTVMRRVVNVRHV